MARTTNRSPEDRLRIGRIICVGGEVFELAVCIALLFLLPWPTNVIVGFIGATMLTSYNIVLWRTIKKQANEQGQGSTYDVL
jgi:hypothetical protein